MTWQQHIEHMVCGYADLVVRLGARVYAWDRLQQLAQQDPELYGALPELVAQRVREVSRDPPDPAIPDQREPVLAQLRAARPPARHRDPER